MVDQQEEWPPERLRALDRAVAEARGWTWHRSAGTGRRCIYPPGKAPDWMYTPADGTEPFVSDLEETCRLYRLPEYSLGCAETFELIEEERIDVAWLPQHREWWANHGTAVRCEVAPTPAIAICLAYLTSKGRSFNE